MSNTHKSLSAAEVLHTLELYFELQSSHLVGQKLGIDHGTVLPRLTPYGVVPRSNHKNSREKKLEDVNDMGYIRALKHYLRQKAEWEKQNPFVVRKSNAVPAIELLSTVALYFQLNSIQKVADNMNISYHAVESRLNGLKISSITRGRRSSMARDFNDMRKVEETMKQLWDEAQIDIYRAQ